MPPPPPPPDPPNLPPRPTRAEKAVASEPPIEIPLDELSIVPVFDSTRPPPMVASLVPRSSMPRASMAVSMPPGGRIQIDPAPPSLRVQLAAVLPDVAAISAFCAWGFYAHEYAVPGALILAVLQGRATAPKLGARAVTGVLALPQTLLNKGGDRE